MWFKEFQDGRHGGHLGYRNETILAILNFYVTVMPPIKFRLNPTHGLGEMSFEEFHDRNETILAILILDVTVKPPIKFRLNPTYGLREDVVCGISRWPPLLQCLPAGFGSISLMVWEEMSFEEFQDGGHLGYRNGTILAILNLYVTVMPPIKFRLNRLTVW